MAKKKKVLGPFEIDNSDEDSDWLKSIGDFQAEDLAAHDIQQEGPDAKED